MAEPEPPPGQSHAAEQLDRVEQQLNMLARRLERIERHMGIEPPLASVPPSVTGQPINMPAPLSLTNAAPPPASSPHVVQQPVTVSPLHTESPPAGVPATTSMPITAATPLPEAGEHKPLQRDQGTILEDIAQRLSAAESSTAATTAPANLDPQVQPQGYPASRYIGPASTGATIPSASSAAMPTVAKAPGTASNISDFEALIGGKWALWVGSLAIFLAIAFFLTYAYNSLSKVWLPPVVRFGLGLAAGATFLVVGAYMRSRVQRWFSEGLCGAGLAILYLSIWTGAQSYNLLPFQLAFFSMTLVTTLGVILAVRCDAVSLIVLASLGGFLTPVLLHSQQEGAAHATALLTYIAVLDAGILGVSLFKRWRGVIWLAFVVSIVLLMGWAAQSYTVEQRWPVFCFVTLYFLFFLGAACFYSLIHKEQTAAEDLILLFTDAFVYACAGYALLNGGLHNFPGAFPLALAFCFALLSLVVRALAPANETLHLSAVGLGLLFVTVTVPIQLKQVWLSVAWSVEAAVLLSLAWRVDSLLLQRFGQSVWALSLGSLLMIEHPSSRAELHMLFLNERALPLFASVLMTGWIAIQTSLGTRSARLADKRAGVYFDGLEAIYSIYAVAGGAWLLAQEIHLAFDWQQAPFTTSGRAGALFVTAIIWSFYAIAVYWLGRKAHNLSLRMCAFLSAMLASVLPIWASIGGPATQWTPFWNLRWASYLFVAGALGILGWLMAHEDTDETAEYTLAATLPNGISLLLLCAITIEVYLTFRESHLTGPATWESAAFFVISIVWAVYALSLLLMGIKWDSAQLRHCAYGIGVGSVLLLLFNAVTAVSAIGSPFLSLRSVAFAICVATQATALFTLQFYMKQRHALHAHATHAGAPDEDEVQRSSASITDMTIAFDATVLPLLKLLLTGVLLWGLTQETYAAGLLQARAYGTSATTVALLVVFLLWMAFAFTLLQISLRWRERALRWCAYMIGSGGIGWLVIESLFTSDLEWPPFRNLRFIGFAFAIAISLLTGYALQHQQEDLEEVEIGFIPHLILLSIALALWAVTQETYQSCYYLRDMLGSHWNRWAQMAISLVWSVCGALLLVAGIARNYQPMRLCALGLLGVTVIKVFGLDLSFLNMPLRVLSFGGLGVALILISWLYSRFKVGRGTVAGG